MRISLAVFDLDGTLVSSHETIYKATIEALHRVGINIPLDQQKFNSMIGWHFEDIFDVFEFKVPDFEKFIAIYKSLYFNYIDSSYLYNNVKETLEYLQSRQIKTALLTTKAQDQAELLVEYFGIKNTLEYIMGRREGIAHKPSPEPLIKTANELNIDIGETLMIGDTEMDIKCGKNAGSKTCAVTYGYRLKEELLGLNPDFIIDSLTELQQIV